MAIEIVDFPMKNGGSFHGKMLVHQRVSLVLNPPFFQIFPDPECCWKQLYNINLKKINLLAYDLDFRSARSASGSQMEGRVNCKKSQPVYGINGIVTDSYIVIL